MTRRSISVTALLFASISAILGSGWLFAAYYTSVQAGPSALLAWLIGGALVIIIAMVYAELSAMFPIVGSSTRIPQFTHGNVVGFIFSWLIWISYLAFVPTEVQAIIQYLNFLSPGLVQINGGLTATGYWYATGLMLLISSINVFSLRWLLRCNSALTLIKIAIPIVISFLIITSHINIQHSFHFVVGHFEPYGFHGVFSAITTGGIIFAFYGFKQATELAGETKNPKRALPIAILGSIIGCLLIYLILQIAFLSSITTRTLSHGWHALNLQSKISPFAAIMRQQHLNWALTLIFTGALLAPFASALMFASGCSRSLYGKSVNGYLPKIFSYLTTKGSPLIAIFFNFIVGMCLFAPLPGWENMISFLSALMGMSYAIAPISLLTLRIQAPNQKRPFKLPLGNLWAMVAFYLCTLIIYWTGWEINAKLSIAIFIGLIILLLHRLSSAGKGGNYHWRESIWIWPYFIGILIISYLGNYGHGHNLIPFGWDFAVIGVFCLLILWLAVKFKLPDATSMEYIDKLHLATQE